RARSAADRRRARSRRSRIAGRERRPFLRRSRRSDAAVAGIFAVGLALTGWLQFSFPAAPRDFSAEALSTRAPQRKNLCSPASFLPCPHNLGWHADCRLYEKG